jgi:hypothetical protein
MHPIKIQDGIVLGVGVLGWNLEVATNEMGRFVFQRGGSR